MNKFFMKRFLISADNVLNMEKDEEKTTLKDVGRGLVLLGGATLLLTAIFFLLAMWDNKYYGLFSGTTHLLFYTILGLALLAVGFILARKESKNAERAEETRPD